jgi:DNA-binding transcriptional LysR family regulator
VAGCGGGICNAMLEEACAEAGYRPPIAFESDDHNVLMGLVSSGVGVTLLPQLALRTAPAGVVVRPVASSDPTRRIFAATPTEGYRSPATEAMIEVLVAVSDRFRAASEAAAA